MRLDVISDFIHQEAITSKLYRAIRIVNNSDHHFKVFDKVYGHVNIGLNYNMMNVLADIIITKIEDDLLVVDDV